MFTHKFTNIYTHMCTNISKHKFTQMSTHMFKHRKKIIILRDILLCDLLHTFVLVAFFIAHSHQAYYRHFPYSLLPTYNQHASNFITTCSQKTLKFPHYAPYNYMKHAHRMLLACNRDVLFLVK
jgi:hypothetical protein